MWMQVAQILLTELHQGAGQRLGLTGQITGKLIGLPFVTSRPQAGDWRQRKTDQAGQKSNQQNLADKRKLSKTKPARQAIPGQHQPEQPADNKGDQFHRQQALPDMSELPVPCFMGKNTEDFIIGHLFQKSIKEDDSFNATDTGEVGI